MPQITQLPAIFWSQLFWLLLIFGTLFFVIGRGMVPKIQGVIHSRDRTIAEDLERAQRAREEAEGTEAEYRRRIESSRAEAMKLAQQAKQAGAREAEERNRAAEAEVALRVEQAEKRIGQALEKAMAEIETVAVDATRELVEKLTGTTVPASEATRAVKAALHG